MTGRKKSGAGVEQLMMIQTASSVKHGAVWCMSVLPVTLGYWCLVMMWQKTWINSEVYRNILSAKIQSNAANLIGQRFIVQVEMTQNILQKQPSFWRYKSGIFCNDRINLLISTWLSCISLAEDKTKDRRPITFEPLKMEGLCIKMVVIP